MMGVMRKELHDAPVNTALLISIELGDAFGKKQSDVIRDCFAKAMGELAKAPKRLPPDAPGMTYRFQGKVPLYTYLRLHKAAESYDTSVSRLVRSLLYRAKGRA